MSISKCHCTSVSIYRNDFCNIETVDPSHSWDWNPRPSECYTTNQLHVGTHGIQVQQHKLQIPPQTLDSHSVYVGLLFGLCYQTYTHCCKEYLPIPITCTSFKPLSGRDWNLAETSIIILLEDTIRPYPCVELSTWYHCLCSIIWYTCINSVFTLRDCAAWVSMYESWNMGQKLRM